MSINW